MYHNATAAAKTAGYSDGSAHTQGSRLMARPEIQERIEQLEGEMETSLDVVSELEDQYQYAKVNNHTNSALKALEVLSRLKSVEEVDIPKSITELEEDIIKDLEILGEDTVAKLFLKCKWYASEADDGDDDDEADNNIASETIKDIEIKKAAAKKEYRYQHRARRKSAGNVLT
tara:strand:+ start:13024 stop:13542 length:519 start_codon:yes stop_codon:yes gene_type:complete